MKKLIVLLCILLIVSSGCRKRITMKNVWSEPSFSGVVVKVLEDSILVEVNEGEEVRNTSDLIYVSLNTELGGDLTAEFMRSDEVVVHFDGVITESDPARIDRVYWITFTSPSKKWQILASARTDIIHTLDGHTARYSFLSNEDYEDIYDLHNWFANLFLTRKHFADGEGPGKPGAAGIWTFILYNYTGQYEEFLTFSFGEYESGNWYLFFYDEWYEVSNPSAPFGD